MARARIKPSSPLPKAAASRKLVGNPKEGNQFGSDAELDALRESLKLQAKGRAGQGKVHTILTQIKKRYGDAELQRAIREFNAAFKGVPRDPDQGKNPRHG
jgi:hypothetical protein